MCLEIMMNNKLGAKAIINHNEVLLHVANNLDTFYPKILLEALKILGISSLISSKGHKKVIEVISMRGENLNEERFVPIIKGIYIGKLIKVCSIH